VLERWLRILAWELGILILLIAYLAFVRPLPGRWHFVALQSGEAVLYDTATGRTLYQKAELVAASGEPAPPPAQAPGRPKDAQ